MKILFLTLNLILSSNLYAIDAAEVTRHNANVTNHLYSNGGDQVNRDGQSETSMVKEKDTLSKHIGIPQLGKFLRGQIAKGSKFKMHVDPKYISSLQDGDEWYRFAWFSIVDGYGPHLLEVEMKKCKGSYINDKDGFQLKEFWAVVEYTGKVEASTDKDGNKVKLPVLNVIECH